MKTLAVLCALANLLTIGLISWFMWFVASFPWENAEDPTGNDWLIPVALVLAATAAMLLFFVVVNRQVWAMGALALQTVMGLGLLSYALDGSSHSDGKLVAIAVGVELAAIASVWLLRAHLARPTRAPAY